jgi:hypothetical protein
MDEWKAYPTFRVERRTVFTFQIYVPKIKYIAVVPEAWASAIEPLLSWKRKKGLSATYFTVEWISSSYKGSDLVARIKEFLKDAFNNWQIDYVLLAGGANVIPPGNYECLDGDGDAFPDLAVGRLPADGIEDLTIMISKIVKYEQQTIVNAESTNFFGVLGEAEASIRPIPRGNPMNAIAVPSSLRPTWLVYGQNLTSPSQINSFIQAGAGLVYENTHGAPSTWWLGWELESYRFDHALSLRNTVLPTVIAGGCNTSDYRQPNCIGTAFLKNPSGGATAYLGWYGFGGANPPSFGCNAVSTLFNVSNWKPGVSIVQGCVFTYPNNLYGPGVPGGRETKEILLGDPEMSVWTTSPKDLALSTRISSVPSGRLVTIQVMDRSLLRPIEGITVRVLGVLEMTSDDQGQIAFKAPMAAGEFTYNVYALYRNKPNRFTITIRVSTATTTITVMTATSSTSTSYSTFTVMSAATSTGYLTSTATTAAPPTTATASTTITSRLSQTTTITSLGSVSTTYFLKTTLCSTSTSYTTSTVVIKIPEYVTTRLSKTGATIVTEVSTKATTSGDTVFETIMIRVTYVEQFLQEIISVILQGTRRLMRIVQSVFIRETIKDTVVKVQPQALFTVTTSASSPRCVIATAAYGSELLPEVQFLRSFRDGSIKSTFAGKNFMYAFDRWYYSTSPFVAESISNNLAARSMMGVILCPLLLILNLSSHTCSMLSFVPELASVFTGLIASSLIGMFYLLPLMIVARVVLGRLRFLISFPSSKNLSRTMTPSTVYA